MKKITIIIFFPLLLIIFMSVFILNEAEQAIIIQFGKPVGLPKAKAGMHFKIPLIQQVYRFDKRLLQWDGDADEMLTKDNKYIWIDAFARWKISNPLKFYKAAKTEILAQSLLDDIIDGGVRDEISNRTMGEIIRFSDRKMEYGEEEVDNLSDDQYEQVEKDVSGARLEIIDAILSSVSLLSGQPWFESKLEHTLSTYSSEGSKMGKK